MLTCGLGVMGCIDCERGREAVAVTVSHSTSTCAMGKVIDERLRVEGVASLQIADASIVSIVVSGDTNAVSIMIGERAAEFILTEA